MQHRTISFVRLLNYVSIIVYFLTDLFDFLFIYLANGKP